MPSFQTTTGEIYYEVLGPEDAPESLTLLHNFMSTGRMAWGPMLGEFAERYRLLLPDLPGHGRSIGHPSGFDHREISRQLQTLIEMEGFEKGHLAGCSGGGMMAQLLVHHGMVAPATLTLVSTTHSVNRETTGEKTSLDPMDFRAGRNWLDRTAELHDEHQGSSYFYDHLLPAFRELRPETTIDLPLEELASWELPVCVIHGTEDELFPVAIAERIVQTLPNGVGHMVDGQTHALIFRQPWRVSSIMLKFLRQHAYA